MAEQVDLRGNPADAAFVAAVEAALGIALPIAANTTSEGNGHVACWLGPDEWLVSTAGPAAPVAARLREALAGVHAAVTEVGAGNTVFVLGEGARDFLAQECPLDLDPSAFGPGRCAQTRFAKAPVLLRPLAGGAMEVTLRASFADYFRRWLHAAGLASPGTGRAPSP